jgi:predicted transcriptional regulator
MWQPTGRRTNIEIIADILRFLRLGETGKIEITYTVKLSREQTSKYLNRLVEANLLEDVEGEIGVPSYRITEKGLNLLSKIENMREMLPPKDALNILHRSKLMEIVAPDNHAVESSEAEEA